MIDFSKRLGKKGTTKVINPLEIYDTLDRESDKGPLRPAQKQILEDWFSSYRDKNDTILKLHTGQGKTLIGLLILQSILNETNEPVVYLCPNNYLVKQTCEQAKSFGISYTTIDGDLPDEFLEGKKILITLCQSMFNGKSKFGIGPASTFVSAILMDDAHICVDIIKESCKIKLTRSHKAYHKLLSLFRDDLKQQGAGAFADIDNGEYSSFLPIPYWAWDDKSEHVTNILSEHREDDEIKFSWPILRDILKYCNCIISGHYLEIYPYITPLEAYRSYTNAKNKIYMSATLSDDSFLIRDLGLNIDTVKNPLCIKDEKWSGEKMVLMPSCIDNSFTQEEIAALFGKKDSGRKYGTIVLTPTFNSAQYWGSSNATICKYLTIFSDIDKLKNGKYEDTLVIVNRYDGIDLPDNSCRILIMDNRPISESLEDKYMERCLFTSEIIAKRIAQKIEQGFGRAVRGEKDYCAIIISGDDLVQFLKSSKTRKLFSKQTQAQINIGNEIIGFALEEMKERKLAPIGVLNGLISQLIHRDDNWKSFYKEHMDLIEAEKPSEKLLTIFEMERKSESLFVNGSIEKAIDILQLFIDKYIDRSKLEEVGWYLQQIAKYMYQQSKKDYLPLQIAAHKNNPYLLKPLQGMEITKIESINTKRIENIIKWVNCFENMEELQIEVRDIISCFSFGADSDKFEDAVHRLGELLGFVCQRPDKEWKEGPDNLWKVRNDLYFLIECKNKVDIDRREISREETGQMNNSIVWFKDNYPGALFNSIMIIATNKLSKGAGFSEDVRLITAPKLGDIKNNVQRFINEMKKYELKSLTESKVQELLVISRLTIDDLLNRYTLEAKEHY